MIRRIKSGQSAESKAQSGAQVRATVEGILDDITARGGAAVRDYSQKFDRWSPPHFRLTAGEIADCVSALPSRTIEDIEFAQAQIRRFARAQRECLKDLEIETLEGPETIKVPEGVQSGKEFRLRGKGVPHLNERGKGDLIVEVRVSTPTRLTKPQRELMKQLSETMVVENEPHSRGLFDKMKDIFG